MGWVLSLSCGRSLSGIFADVFQSKRGGSAGLLEGIEGLEEPLKPLRLEMMDECLPWGH